MCEAGLDMKLSTLNKINKLYENKKGILEQYI